MNQRGNNETVAIYKPAESAGFGSLIRVMWRDLESARHIAWQFTISDIRSKYRQTVLGVLWEFVIPLATAATWLFIHSTGIVRVTSTGMSYPAFVISGTFLWAIFIEATNAPLQQTLSARTVLAKINFPREALLLSGMAQTAFNAAIKVAILLVILPMLGSSPGWTAIFIPLAVFSLILAGTAIGILLAPIGTLFLDIGKGLPLLLQFLMYLSPVVYTTPKTGVASALIGLNPLSSLIVWARGSFAGASPENWGTLLLINAAVVVLLVPGWMIYRSAMPILVERMST